MTDIEALQDHLCRSIGSNISTNVEDARTSLAALAGILAATVPDAAHTVVTMLQEIPNADAATLDSIFTTLIYMRSRD